MSNDKKQSSADGSAAGKPPPPKPPLGLKPSAGKSAAPPKAAPSSGMPVVPPKPIPLFRQIDWLTFAITTLLVFIGYFYTLAPDMTLQDSGELAVASMYAGVPHPPGYPVWTIYTWVFTKILPFSNIAWRVGVSSAVAAALACGLIAMMVSRGCSMMMEGIAELKAIERRWENALCVVSGFVAGMLLGFNGFMWSQAVIVEVYTLSVLSLAGVLLCLMRWIYAPHQMRYLYLAFFWFGICFNNHQSLLVVALGLEVAIVAVNPRLGRELFFWNVIVWAGGLVGKSMGMISTLNDNPPLLFIYNLVGFVSFVVWVVLLILTKKRWPEHGRDFLLVASLAYLVVLLGHITSYATLFYYGGDLQTLKTGTFILFNLFGLACIGGWLYLVRQHWHTGREWLASLVCGATWSAGALFYVYMALASMSNPPLNWGYPRTVTGFFHAFTRGQYERIHPTFGQSTFFNDMGRFFNQIGMYVSGALEEFNLVYLLIAVIPFLFLRRMQKRERAWMIGLTTIYLCLSFFLLILLNPAPDRQSRDLNKVFFTASHVMLAMFIGYGIMLIGALLATHFDRYKKYVLGGFGLATLIAFYGLVESCVSTENPLVHATGIFGLVLAGGATLLLGISSVSRIKALMTELLVVFALMPADSVLSHWEENEQRGHLFGYWFGHDMFTPPFNGPDGKPIYPEMDPHTVLYGGTDPGRFNPTYMIFCESFIPPRCKPRDPNFDRRDVYLITQNALADGTYLNYIRAHYNRSAQIDPPFFSELLRGPKEMELGLFTNIVARLVTPLDTFFLSLGDNIEKSRRVGSSFFKPKDFTDLPGLAARLRGQQDPMSKLVFAALSQSTQTLVGQSGNDAALRGALARDLNALLEKGLFDYRLLRQKSDEQNSVAVNLETVRVRRSQTPAGEEANKLATAEADLAQKLTGLQKEIAGILAVTNGLTLPDHVRLFLEQNPQSHTRIRLARLLLEAAYPKEIARSPGGVYPDREILTATPDDSQRCFQEYLADAQKRLDHDRRFPNEPRQIRPGEDVRIVDNRVQVSGQVAVMAINGLLTKVIFDKNPGHSFYVEESFPLDWMYPHLTPYGIIMKINRNPVPEITEEMTQKDHDFWSQYSTRTVGNWITYDTPISNICAFAEKVYLRRDYRGFQGDRKFIRDNDGQKAFSKLRSSIAGVYNWRIANSRNPLEQQRMIKEAEFAFKQAYAFCPYSPEAVFRYINLLISLGRAEDALLIATTSKKLDPYNAQLENLVSELRRIRQQQAAMTPPPAPVAPPTAPPAAAQLQAEAADLERQLAAAPGNLQTSARLLSLYLQQGQTNKAVPLADQILANPQADASTLLQLADACRQMSQFPRVVQALEKLVKLIPDNPEAWFDLAGFQALANRPPDAVASLRKALELSAQRLARDPQAPSLYSNALTDGRFFALRQTPEFQKLVADFKPPAK